MNRNSKSRRARSTQPSGTKREPQSAQATRRASLPLAEMLEGRMLLSVSASSLVGQAQTPGTQATYYVTDSSYPATNTVTTTVAGPVTAPTGQSAMKLDSHIVTHSGTTTTTSEDIDYNGLTSAGYVEFAEHYVSSSHTSDDAYVPPLVELPPTLSVGQTYNSSYTDNWTVNSNSHGHSNHTRAITLDSASTQSVTVPAGTFNAYKVTAVDQTINGGSSTNHLYYAPGIGLVKWTGGDASGTTTWVLTSFSGVKDTLAFSTQPKDTPQDGTMAPVTVEFLNSKKEVDTNSTADVTLTLAGGRGTLNGSKTVAAVDGVATFKGLSVNKGGTYTLTAAASNTAGSVTSAKFKITGDHLVITKEPPNSAVNTPIPLVVSFENIKNQIDTSETGTVTLTLKAVQTGKDTPLGGTVLATLVNGVATFSDTAGPTVNAAGTYTLTATQMQGGVAVDSTTAATSAPFNIFKAVGMLAFGVQPGAGTAGWAISPAVTVKVENAAGQLQTSDTSKVTLAVFSGPAGAVLGGTIPVAAVGGIATFKDLKLNLPGTYQLVATDGSLGVAQSQKFTVNVSKKLVFGSTPTTATAGAAVPSFSVKVEDAAGNIAIGDGSTVTLTIATGPAKVATLTAVAVKGIATFSKLMLTVAGTYTLKATDGLLTPAVSQPITITPAAAAKLVLSTIPATETAGGIIPPFSVSVEDKFGNLVTGNSSTITLAIASGPTGAKINGILMQKAVKGVATFSGLSLNIAGACKLKATDGSLTAAVSQPITIIPAAAAKLVLSTIKATNTAGVAIPSFKVMVEDKFGNVVTSDSSTVKLAIANGPAGAKINGMLTQKAVKGIATFSGLSLNTAGIYKFNVTDGLLAAAMSQPITITPAAPAKLGIASQPTKAAVNGKLNPPFVIDVLDAFGNIVTVDASTVKLTIVSKPSGGAISGTPSAKAAKGVATFSGLTFKVAGTYIVSFTDGKLTPKTSLPIIVK